MRDGWVETTLGEVAEWWSGGTPKAREPKYYEDGTIPWAVIADMNKGIIDSTNSYITEEALELIGGRLAPVGSVLISMYASVGKSAIANIPLATNQAIAWSIPNQKKIIPYYLYLVSQQLEKEISDLARGATQRNINRQMLREFSFELPPLPEQKRIVDLISSVDSYIEALQQQLENAKRSRNAVLHELLTAGGDDWVETTLGQEFEICKNGKNYKDGISTEGIPISRIQTIASGKIDLTKVGFGNLFLEDAEGFLLEEGDILFSHINSLPHVGKVAIVQHNHLPLIHGMNLLRMRFTNSNDTNFMFYLMQNESMRDEIKSRAQIAVNQVSINISSIKTIKIVIPPLRTQIEIASMVGAWDSLIEECENNLNSSRNLRVGLLSELLSGKHEIPTSYDKVIGAA
jgi:type I restriction enzyme S subunit